MTKIHLQFITPLFSRGAYEDRPEIRPPSIRGQLHWWLRALGGGPSDERAIFGSVHKDFGGRGAGVSASKVVVRVANASGDDSREFPAMKHKEHLGRQSNPRRAFAPGSSCDLILLERLGGIPQAQRAVWNRTLEAWLLLGTLGLRATRAGGSFVWACDIDPALSPPDSFGDYEKRIAGLTQGTPAKAALLGAEYKSAEEARRDVSDTIGGRDDREGDSDLARVRHPLGRVFGGRKTSPLRFRIVQINGICRIAAVWDGRSAVTGNRDSDLSGAIDLLKRRGKPIGEQLAAKFA